MASTSCSNASSSSSTSRVHIFAVSSQIILKLFIFSQEIFDFFLKPLLSLSSIIFLVLKIRLFLFPFGSFLFKSKHLLSLLSLGTGTLSIKLSQLLLIVLPFFVKESLIFSISRFSFRLSRIKFFLETSFSFKCFLKSLLEGTLFGHSRFALELTLFKKDLLLSFELFVANLQL